jgi:hypothetical protein
MSLVSGLRSGIRSALRSGLNPSDLSNPMAGVTLDAASGKYFPATDAEWTITMAAAGISSGNPSALHLLQDASGNPVDVYGLFPLAASGTGLTYRQAVAGYTRLAMGTTSGTSGLLQSLDASLPDLGSADMLSLFVAKATTTAARRDILGLGAAATPMMVDTEATTGLARAVCVGNVATGAADAGGVVRPWAVQSFRSSSVALVASDAEKLLPTFAATVAGKSLSIGNYKFGGSTSLYLYLVTFFNAAARLTAAQIKAIWQVCGWTIAW